MLSLAENRHKCRHSFWRIAFPEENLARFIAQSLGGYQPCHSLSVSPYLLHLSRPELFQGCPMSCATHRTLLVQLILSWAIQSDLKIISPGIRAWPSSLTVLRYVCWKVEVDTAAMIPHLTKSRYIHSLYSFRHMLTTLKAYYC